MRGESPLESRFARIELSRPTFYFASLTEDFCSSRDGKGGVTTIALENGVFTPSRDVWIWWKM
jgi:hypothetical protein